MTDEVRHKPCNGNNLGHELKLWGFGVFTVWQSCLHLAETLYPPRGAGFPSAASNPADTRTTSGENSWAMGITTDLQGQRVQLKKPRPAHFNRGHSHQSKEILECFIVFWLSPNISGHKKLFGNFVWKIRNIQNSEKAFCLKVLQNKK